MKNNQKNKLLKTISTTMLATGVGITSIVGIASCGSNAKDSKPAEKAKTDASTATTDTLNWDKALPTESIYKVSDGVYTTKPEEAEGYVASSTSVEGILPVPTEGAKILVDSAEVAAVDGYDQALPENLYLITPPTTAQPAVAAKPAVPAKDGENGFPAIPAIPAIPASPAIYTSTLSEAPGYVAPVELEKAVIKNLDQTKEFTLPIEFAGKELNDIKNHISVSVSDEPKITFASVTTSDGSGQVPIVDEMSFDISKVNLKSIPNPDTSKEDLWFITYNDVKISNQTFKTQEEALAKKSTFSQKTPDWFTPGNATYKILFDEVDTKLTISGALSAEEALSKYIQSLGTPDHSLFIKGAAKVIENIPETSLLDLENFPTIIVKDGEKEVTYTKALVWEGMGNKELFLKAGSTTESPEFTTNVTEAEGHVEPTIVSADTIKEFAKTNSNKVTINGEVYTLVENAEAELPLYTTSINDLYI